MAEKEVATKERGEKVRENSYGVPPKDVKLSKGAEMYLFGHRATEGEGIWPKKTTSPNAHTDYPKGMDK